MPRQHGLRLDANQGLTPLRPGPTQPDPEEPIVTSKPGTNATTLQNLELVPQRSDLEEQVAS